MKSNPLSQNEYVEASFLEGVRETTVLVTRDPEGLLCADWQVFKL